MKFVEWKDEYSVGDPLMDAHHRTFFEMVREQGQALKMGAETTNIPGLLDFLSDYIAMHFRAEERLLGEVDYPYLDQHRSLHRGLTEQVRELEQTFRANEESLNAEALLAFSQNWFFVHILQEDKKYATHV
jgi:hemerythrin